MSQHGSATIIGPQTRLILMDCFETLVELEGRRYRARLGIDQFLAHFRDHLGIPVVVVSDADETQVAAALEQAGLSDQIDRVYHQGNASRVLGDGRQRKRLAPALTDFSAPPASAIFIGDSPLDGEAAQAEGVGFIRVPRSEDRRFTFAALIQGPSRYASGDFTQVLMDRYRPDDQGRTP